MKLEKIRWGGACCLRCWVWLPCFSLNYCRVSCLSIPSTCRGVSPALGFQYVISFNTTQNWQNYGGETTMTYFTQMVGLTVHNFLSAAAGIAY